MEMREDVVAEPGKIEDVGKIIERCQAAGLPEDREIPFRDSAGDGANTALAIAPFGDQPCQRAQSRDDDDHQHPDPRIDGLQLPGGSQGDAATRYRRQPVFSSAAR
jgi:hypothetical protein